MPGVNSKELVYNSFDLDKELTKVNPVEALVSGKIKKSDIGRIVYLSNSYTTCQEWKIADINHDSTECTVDLFPKYTLCDASSQQNGSWLQSFGYTANYGISSTRNLLNGAVYNGFDYKIQAGMGTQDVYGDGTLNDKIKAPSMAELGFTSDNTDGSIYPLFGTEYINWLSKNEALKMTRPNGIASSFFTRTTDRGNGYIYSCNSNGSISYHSYTNLVKLDCAGICRFTKNSIVQELLKPNPIDTLASGKITKDFIGFPVTLTNSNADCQEWVIADVNHEDNIGTVDLISRSSLKNFGMYFNSNGNSNYASSELRTYLNSDVINGFDTKVKSAIKTQSFLSGNNTLNDKIKTLSINEIGLGVEKGYAVTYDGGVVYPIFGSESIGTYRPINSKAFNINRNYWTRTQDTNNNMAIIFKIADGKTGSLAANSNELPGVIACIRL